MSQTLDRSTDALHIALAEFVGAFQEVFHYDWEYTRSMIGSEDPTFLRPSLTEEQETEDWGARGALLEKYRALIVAMSAVQLKPRCPFPHSGGAEMPFELE